MSLARRQYNHLPIRERDSTLPIMSLFGSSPENSLMGNSVQQSKSSLFADEPSAGASSSLFADDDTSSSPWNTHTNKRASRQQLVKTLLPGLDVPESYINAYNQVLNVGDRVGAGIGLTSVREILSGSGLSATDQERILNLVVSDGESTNANIGVGRGEFNVLLALVGLAQEGEDLTYDAVDDRRKSRFSLVSFVSLTSLFCCHCLTSWDWSLQIYQCRRALISIDCAAPTRNLVVIRRFRRSKHKNSDRPRPLPLPIPFKILARPGPGVQEDHH